MIHATGREATMAIVEELTLKACRLRSLGEFSLGETVTFDVVLRGAPKVPLNGRVSSAAENGVRRSYTITFDDVDGRQADRIAMALDMARRFASTHHVEHPTGTALTRSSPRIPLDTELIYMSDALGRRRGRMTNLSTGGILMNADETDVPVGASLELRFTLPGAGELHVHARVVAHQAQSPNYNIAFYQVPAETLAALERFVAERS
jgi:hypothetical protein